MVSVLASGTTGLHFNVDGDMYMYCDVHYILGQDTLLLCTVPFTTQEYKCWGFNNF